MDNLSDNAVYDDFYDEDADYLYCDAIPNQANNFI